LARLLDGALLPKESPAAPAAPAVTQPPTSSNAAKNQQQPPQQQPPPQQQAVVSPQGITLDQLLNITGVVSTSADSSLDGGANHSNSNSARSTTTSKQQRRRAVTWSAARSSRALAAAPQLTLAYSCFEQRRFVVSGVDELTPTTLDGAALLWLDASGRRALSGAEHAAVAAMLARGGALVAHVGVGVSSSAPVAASVLALFGCLLTTCHPADSLVSMLDGVRDRCPRLLRDIINIKCSNNGNAFSILQVCVCVCVCVCSPARIIVDVD
jgi:hypothetical protein